MRLIRWQYMAFLPILNPLAWVWAYFSSRKLEHLQWFVFYAMPYVFQALHAGKPPAYVVALELLTWLGGMVHVTILMLKKPPLTPYADQKLPDNKKGPDKKIKVG